MALTIEQFNAKYGIGGDKAPTAGGVQQPDITLRDVKTGALPRITRGIGAGLKQGATSAYKGIVTVADAIVPDRFEKLQSNVDSRFDWLERQDQKIQDKLVRKLGADGANMYITQASSAVGQGLGQLGSALVNPAVGFTVIGSQALGAGKSAYDKAYSEAVALGKTPEQAKRIARINGYITGAVNMAEMIPVGRAVGLAKDVARKPASMAAKQFISRFGKNALSEVGTEAGQDFISSLTAKLTYDEDGEPLADAINSALVSIPTSLLFAGAGEVGNYQKVEQAKVDISAILESQGATKEEADTLAEKMVEQRMIYDDGKDFEEMPAEIKESYEGAVGYLRWQNEQIAVNPDFSIDQAKSDAAYQIIDAFDSYNQKANEQAIQQEEVVGEEMVSTTEKIVNFVKSKVNGDGALNKWREDSGKKFEALEKKIQEEKKKIQAQEKRDARNARARELRKEKKQEKLKSELEIQKQELADLEKKAKRRERYNAIKQQRAEFLNEPYIPDDQLPVINAGSIPRDTSVPSVQVGADATGIPQQIPGYTYQPVDDYATMSDAMLKYMEEQNQLLAEVVTESETKATKEKTSDGKKESSVKMGKNETALDEDIETARKKIAKIESQIDSLITDFTQDVTKEQLVEAREQFTEATGIPLVGEGVGFAGLKPIGGAGAKTSGLATSARIKEIEAGIVSEGTGFEDLPQTDRMSWAQQFPIVEELIKNDIELARDIAFGYRNPPEGVSGSIVYVKYLEKMMLENNIDEVDALKNSPMMDIATAVGQFSAGLGAIPSGENPVAIAREIEKNRTESAQKKLPRGADIKQVRKEIITSTKKKAEAETKKAIKEKEQWNAFLEEISC